ncbi:acyltransferase [Arcobacter cloacae]|uniref:Acetyltransferase n=1 Tax=Arcobacter cloacae TaxID=1054034 RepID=A0A6M8NQ14_9BACT|nr:acyltransferase [Arcobacter cloacae]QKF90597.1 acyltransferase [Arcobacter cloacae]RXI37585.1 acetyltransferase [Arcobacter cloacae]
MLTKLKKFINLPLSRKLQVLSSIYYKLKSQIFYKLMFKSMGVKSVIKKPLFLTPEYISIGNGCYIWNDARIEAITSYANENFNPHIILEDGVTIQQRCHITAADTLIIGKDTAILFDVMITNIDHEYENVTMPVGNQPLMVKKTQIGENCFIGSGAKIQAGTILGRHCIVGTNAVIRGTFPDYSVIVGVPARIVKRYDEKSGVWRKTDKKGEFVDE